MRQHSSCGVNASCVEALEQRRLLAAGDLDRTFASGGIFQAAQRVRDAEVVARAADGKFLIGGAYAQNTFESGGISLARFTADGAEDLSFGVDGRFDLDLVPGSERVLAITPQVDGGSLVLVAASSNFPGLQWTFVLGLTSSGTLDRSFARKGIFTTRLAYARDAKISLIEQPDKKILIGGLEDVTGNLLMLRLTANGAIDTSFDADGVARSSISGTWANIDLRSDGKIAAVGFIGAETIPDPKVTPALLVARFTAEGAPDPAFGVRTLRSRNARNIPTELHLLADDSMLVVAQHGGSQSAYVVNRYDADGNAIAAYGTSGTAPLPAGPPLRLDVKSDGSTLSIFGANDFESITLLSPTGQAQSASITDTSVLVRDGIFDGESIIAAVTLQTSREFALQRYSFTGTLDQSFGEDGIAKPAIRATVGDFADVKALASGKVLATGSITQNGQTKTGVWRFTAGGAIDTSFGGGDGVAMIFAQNSYGQLEVQSDGKILVRVNTGIARLTAAGALDSTFASSGILPDDKLFTLQGDKILTLTGGAIARYTANGQYDPTWHQQTVPPNSDGQTIAVDADGKVLIGRVEWFVDTDDDNEQRYVVTRFKPDGAFDTTFTPINFVEGGGLSGEIFSSGGRIFVVGSTYDWSLIARINPDGTTDTTFGDQYSGLYTNAAVDDLSVAPDGKVLTTSFNDDFADGGPTTITRYNNNGTRDASFSLDSETSTSFFQGRSIIVGPNGDVIVVGQAFGRALGIGRYSAASTPAFAGFNDDGNFIVQGTDAADHIVVNYTTKNARVMVNDKSFDFVPSGRRVNIFAGAGDDFIEIDSFLGAIASGEGGDDTILGSTATDGVFGTNSDTLIGGSGNDKIIGRGGNDNLSGGDGRDTLVSSSTPLPDPDLYFFGADLSGGIGNDILIGGANRDSLRGGSGDDLLTATAPASLSGNGGNDTLVGSSGADQLSGGEDDDSLIGQGGADHVYGDNIPDGFENFGEGNDTLMGGAGNDVLDGGFDDDSISGGDGNDKIFAGFGDDILRGNAGDDWLDAGEGQADDVDGGGGFDTVDCSSYIFFSDLFRVYNQHLSLDDVDNDGFAGDHDNIRSTIEYVIGGEGDDRIIGSAANNRLIGNGGDDTIHGMDGDDVLFGNVGHDKLFGDGGNDFLAGVHGGRDTLDGGDGDDNANADAIDIVASIEQLA